MQLLQLFFICIQVATARNMYIKLPITQLRSGKGWIFLHRMKFSAGQSTIQLEAHLFSTRLDQHQYHLTFVAIQHWQWLQESTFKCLKANYTNTTEANSLLENNTLIKFQQHLNYSYSFQKILNLKEEKTIYFVLKDCQSSLINLYFHSDNYIEIKLRLLSNGQYLSSDEISIVILLPILMISTIFFIFKVWKKTNDANTLQYVTKALLMALIFNTLNLFFNLLYYAYIYQYGLHLVSLYCIHLIFQSLSQSIFLTIFILLSFGWTINNKSTFNSWLATTIALIWISIVLLSEFVDEKHEKHHKYDGLVSFILIVMRVLLAFVFIVACIYQIFKAQSQKIQKFYFHLFRIGSIFFGFIPIIAVLADNISFSARNEFVFLTTGILHILITGMFTWTLVDKSSIYQQVSLVSKSFMEN